MHSIRIEYRRFNGSSDLKTLRNCTDNRTSTLARNRTCFVTFPVIELEEEDVDEDGKEVCIRIIQFS